MVSCTCAVEAVSCRAMSGSDGRYISVVRGPTALRPASKAVSANVPERSMRTVATASAAAALAPCACALLLTEAMQAGAVHVEPGFGAGQVRGDALDQPPEPARVIHLEEVSDLVRGEILQHERRRQDEPPGIGQQAGRRTGAPAARLVADRDALEAGAKQRRRQIGRA